jgi:hypothetical protein
MVSESAVLTNGLVRIHFEDAGACPGMFRHLEYFLHPYFERTASGSPDFTLRFAVFSAFPKEWNAACTAAVRFRRSSCPSFNLSGRAGTADDELILGIDEVSETAYAIEAGRRRITFFGSPHNQGSENHLLDFTRYLSLLIAEAAGSVLLHASAVMLGGRLFLILGDKGAGKTTTMLRLVAECGAQYYSGDKVLASLDADGLILRAWPDIPYIGIGSLRGLPDLASSLGIELTGLDGEPRPDYEKQLVPLRRFRETVPQSRAVAARNVAAILLPEVSSADAGHAWMPVQARKPESLAGFIEWPHEFLTVQWHRLFLNDAENGVPDRGMAVLERLTAVPWLRLSGKDVPFSFIGMNGGAGHD